MARIANLPLGLRILSALLVGVLVGVVLPKAGTAAWSDTLVRIFSIAGQLWLSALQMTVLPLVFSLLVVGLGSPTVAARGGSVAKRAITVFAALYLFSLIVAVALNLFLLNAWPVSSTTIEAFRKFAATSIQVKAPDPRQVILSVVPSNVFGALAAGAMLPVVVFGVLFGLAMRHLDMGKRERLAELVASIADVMFKIVAWVLLLAPFGVFGLVVGTVHDTGLAIVWGLAGYLRYVVTIQVVMLALCYPVAVLWGRISLPKFAAATMPSQLVAASTQSSVASLPVMIESATNLGVPDGVTSVSLPLAVSVFRFSGPAMTLSAAAYAAAAAGLHLGVAALTLGALLSLLIEFAGVGLPNQVNVIAQYAPVMSAFGAPLGILPVILAVDPIVDVVGTTGNVSMDVAASAVIEREQQRLRLTSERVNQSNQMAVG